MNNNRRGWVKNAIIIFLAIMLILTFFSNTIMNYSLPEVAAQYAQSGSITSKIRTTSTVTANSKQKINIDETRTVSAVAVKEGQQVEQGDVLFYLVDAESNELKNAREMLASLEKQYTLKMLESGADYYADELAIRQKQDEIAKAKEQLGKISGNAALLDTLNAEIKQLTADKKALDKQITAYNNRIAKLQSQAADVSLDGKTTAERIDAAQIKHDTAKTAYDAAVALRDSTAAALEAADEALRRATESYEALSPDGSVSFDSLTEQLNELNKTIRRYKEDYKIRIEAIDKQIDEAYDAWVDADWSYNSALALYNQGQGSYDAVLRWEEKSEAARLNYESVLASQKPLKDAEKLTYDRGLEDYNERLAKLEAQLSDIKGTEKARTELDRATKAKKAADTAAADASEEHDKRKTEFSESKATLEALKMLAQLEECESAVEELNLRSELLGESINDKNEEKQELSAIGNDTTQQNERIKMLEQELETLRHNLSKRKEEDDLNDKRDQLEIDELLNNIDKQKELVAKFEANSVDAKITASISGQVTSLTAVAGSETGIGQTLCEIVVTELGYSCEIPLSAEQARRVRVGDSVSVSNNWWSNIDANIVAIRNDPKNPGANKIATIALSGDVAVGQSLNLTIGEKGQTYDSVVPNSAIREDNNGKFVLSVEAKSSPLGNRYIARRIDVTVLASDDTNTAVSGLIGSEFVITTSTVPIAAGAQVRMAN